MENIIRPVALGRKNRLFAGSADGAHRMAILSSLIATCKLNGIVAYEYFHHILPKVADYPAHTDTDLTPANWKAARKS